MAENGERDVLLTQATRVNTTSVVLGRSSLRALQSFNGESLPQAVSERADRQLDEFHQEYLGLKDAPVELIAEYDYDSRGDLIIQAADLIAEYAKANIKDERRREKAIHASLTGCGDSVAFLELISRFEAREGAGEFSEETVREAAKRSFPTLLELASMSLDGNGAFMASACTWSLSEINSLSNEELYRGLEFDDSFFMKSDEGVVVIRSDSQTRRRIRTPSGRAFDTSPNRNDILLGCPYRSRIGRLYWAMFDAMMRNGFMEEAYEKASY